jgi:hypothetical protein
MTLSNQVREHFFKQYVAPARSLGASRVVVKVMDVSRALRWQSRFPLICSALTAETFHPVLGVTLRRASRPCPSSSTELEFELL